VILLLLCTAIDFGIIGEWNPVAFAAAVVLCNPAETRMSWLSCQTEKTLIL